MSALRLPWYARGVKRLGPLAACVCLALLAARPLEDPDLWWHLDNGRRMLLQGTLLPLDDRAFTVPAAVRVNPSWLWDLGTAAVERVAGVAPLLWLPTLAVFAALMLLRWTGRLPAWLLVWVAPALLTRAHPRPDLWTFVLPILLLAAQEPGTRGAGWSAVAFGIGLLWPQIHGSVLLVPALMGPLLVEGLLRGRPVRGEALALVGVAVGVVVHPSGPVALTRTLLGQLDRDPAATPILEWQPWLGPAATPLAVWALVGLGAIYVLVATSWRASSVRPWGLLAASLGLTGAALASGRFAAVAVVVAATLAGRVLSAGDTARRGWAIAGWASTLPLGALLLRLPGIVAGPWVPPLEAPPAILGPLAQVPARPDGAPRRILDFFDLGGILGWQLAGSWQVAVDPRAELAYPTEVQAAVRAAFEGAPGLAAFDAAYAPDAVVTPKLAPACGLLAADPEWSLAGVDGTYALFVRSGLGHVDVPDACGDERRWLAVCLADPAHAAIGQAVALAEASPDPFAARVAGMLLFACGRDPVGAARWLDVAVDRDPTSPASRDARRRLHVALQDDLAAADERWLAWFAPGR